MVYVYLTAIDSINGLLPSNSPSSEYTDFYVPLNQTFTDSAGDELLTTTEETCFSATQLEGINIKELVQAEETPGDTDTDQTPDTEEDKDDILDWVEGASNSVSEWLGENTGLAISSGASLILMIIIVIIIVKRR